MYHLAFLPLTLSLQVKWTSSQVPILIVLSVGHVIEVYWIYFNIIGRTPFGFRMGYLQQ